MTDGHLPCCGGGIALCSSTVTLVEEPIGGGREGGDKLGECCRVQGTDDKGQYCRNERLDPPDSAVQLSGSSISRRY